MSKGNSHKKYYREDKFGRRWYCQHARLNLARSEKKIGRKKFRQSSKKDLTNED